MINYQQNNLGASSSPYLQQHRDNPVHWQEWSEEVLDRAKKSNSLILVSIGYATCHWCHVMAAEAFSDPETADYLNKNFIAIKVDREQRPDIDEYFMSFMHSTNSQGGWPLNVVLSPDGYPFFGGTYFPLETKFGLRPFREILEIIKNWYLENKDSIREYELSHIESDYGKVDRSTLADAIYPSFDIVNGGFGAQTKFPPHNSLLLLMNYFDETGDSVAKDMIIGTLDAMARGGLHDHLQGGFYRYCVDQGWTIPHFEKMLYDQAMHLWVYSTAFKLFGRDDDKRVALKIIKCLRETFSDGSGLFYSAHDADTDHVEGETYVWGQDELKNILSEAKLELFSKEYDITSAGNFEGKNHLVKSARAFVFEKNTNASSLMEIELQAMESDLLNARKARTQPFTDKKIITSWNALAGIGLVMASRYLEEPDNDSDELFQWAAGVFNELLRRHMQGDKLAHSSLGGDLQNQEFLEDHAALLLLATYLYEDAQVFNDSHEESKLELSEAIKTQNEYSDQTHRLLKSLDKFKGASGQSSEWFSNVKDTDIQQIPAQAVDHPAPSAVSMAVMARLRAGKIINDPNTVSTSEPELTFKSLLGNDFYNLAAYYSGGALHEIHAPEKIPWPKLPINSLQLKGVNYQDCSGSSCKVYPDMKELLKSLSQNPVIKDRS